MPRPVFDPDDAQRAILDEMKRLAGDRTRVNSRLDALIVRAAGVGIPIDHIARAADVTRKTVYRHLGRPMR